VANPQVVVDFIANTEKLTKGFSSAGDGATGFGSKVKGLAKAGVIAAGAAGLAALAGTLKVGIDEMEQSAKVAAQTAAVIKSTGGAAGVTAKQVENLAGALMRKTGIDDETIQSGENLLLTFRNVQNQAGKGNDIFTRATRTMLDMSVALGQDTSTSAIQLGKALNDPIRGVSALQRVGVTFTAAQKDQIKALVDSGHTLEAQKIILGELNKEFGGSAVAAGKTLPGQLNILKESFNNLAGQLVSVLVPALSAITKFFVDNPGLAKAMTIGILAIAAAMVVLNAALAVTAAIGSPITVWIIGITAAVAALIAIAVLLAKNWDKVTGALKSGFDTIKNAGQAVFNWLKSNWPLLVGILTGPIGLAIAMIIKHWDTIKNATNAAFDAIRNKVADVIGDVRDALNGLATFVWNLVHGTLGNALNAARDLFSAVTKGAWDALDGVKNALNAMADWLWMIVHGILGNALSAARDLFDAISKGAWDAFDAVRNALNALAGWLWGFVNGALSRALAGAKAVFHAITAGAWDAVSGVKDALNAAVNFVWGIVQRVGNAASAIANAIKAPINAVLSAWNSIQLHVPSINLPSVKIFGHKIGGGSIGGFTIGFPNVPLLAQGGVVDQPTLAMIGEAGREIVTPENLLREIMGQQAVEVHVYIGQTELTDLVRTQIVNTNTGIARTLLAGAS
jgi:phage-related protein